MNLAKIAFAEPTVITVGMYQLGAAGYAPEYHKVAAISEFPMPANFSDFRSFMDIVGQLDEFSARIYGAVVPLLKPKIGWRWTAQHVSAFAAVKRTLPGVVGSADHRKDWCFILNSTELLLLVICQMSSGNFLG